MKRTLFSMAVLAVALLCTSVKQSNRKSGFDLLGKLSTDSSKWTYADDVDPVTLKSRFQATITSANTLDFKFPYEGGSNGELTIINQGGRNEVMLSISKGQFLSGDDHPVYVWFSANKKIGFRTSEPSDLSTDMIFLDPAGKFIKNVKNTPSITIEVEFYQEGTRQITFDVAGLRWNH